jgi:hypothetical protein
MVFGVSAGGLVVLEAARTVPGIRMIAVYEPALAMDATRNTAWLERFDHELADGKLAAAMITTMYGLELAPPFFRIMPRRLLASLTEMAMKSEDSKAAPDAITMRKLAPTIHFEGVLIAEMAGRVDTFRTVSADVLILGGSKGLPFLKPARDALARTLPRSRRVEFPGLDHGASSDPSTTNPGSTGPSTFHEDGLTASYRAASDHRFDSGAAAFANQTSHSFYYLTGVDVTGGRSRNTVVTFGDSITNGHNSVRRLRPDPAGHRRPAHRRVPDADQGGTRQGRSDHRCHHPPVQGAVHVAGRFPAGGGDTGPGEPLDPHLRRV